MSRKKTAGKSKKIAVAVIVVIFVALICFVAANYSNISAIYKGLTLSSDEINSNLEQNKQDTSQALQNAGINVSEEDFEKLNSGELSSEEILQIIQGGITTDNQQNDSKQETSDEQPSGTDKTDEENEKDVTGTEQNPEQSTEIKPDEPDEVEQKPQDTQTVQKPEEEKPKDQMTSENVPVGQEPVLSEAEYNIKISELIAKVYSIKSNFMATLDSFEEKIISEYKALPEEQRTTATKAAIIADNMSYMLSLEAQCDAQIKAVTDEMTALMKQYGKDLTLVDSINTAYINEKELKKAYYINLYKK